MRAVMGWPPEKRRKAALAFLAAAVAIGIAVIAVPVLLAHRHYDRALEDVDARLMRYERLAASRPALEQKLEAVRAMGGRRSSPRSACPSTAALSTPPLATSRTTSSRPASARSTD